MISSVTNELDRTRQELDSARTAAAASVTIRTLPGHGAGASTKLGGPCKWPSPLPKIRPRELFESSGRTEESPWRDYAHATELSEKSVLEEQLAKLRDSIDASGNLSSGTARAEYVNKLLVELNAAKREVVEAELKIVKSETALVEQVAGLEDELQATKLDLEKPVEILSKRAKESPRGNSKTPLPFRGWKRRRNLLRLH